MPTSELVVYTCITADYDWLVPPVFTSKHIRFICFTDSPRLSARGWEIRPIAPSLRSLPPNLVNRRLKFFPWDFLAPHTWSLYIDGNVRLLRDPRFLLADAAVSDARMLVPAHPDRCTARQELDACVRLGKIRGPAIEVAERRLGEYASAGYADSHPLTENNIIFRSGDPTAIRPAMEAWWHELRYFSGRDQISLPYITWKFDLALKALNSSSRYPDPNFRGVNHRRGIPTLFNYVESRQCHGPAWGSAFRLLTVARNLVKR